MLVTFRSKAWTSVTMFGDVAVTLLKMMGHSGTVPSALRARDIPQALDRLQGRLEVTDPDKPAPKHNNADDAEPRVELRTRAYPLIPMLRASAREDADVLWDENRSPI
jgi:hypothetical protein